MTANAITRRDFSAGTLAASILAAAGSAHAEQAGAPLSSDAIKAILKDRVERARQSVGLVVGIISPAGREIVVHGALDQNDPRTLDGDTMFGIASVGKVFTALLLSEAIVAGKMSLSDPLSKHLPGVALPKTTREITLRDLAMHASGLPHELPDAIANSEAGRADPRRAFYDFLAAAKVSDEPGKTWAYSNIDYTLLGRALEHRLGHDYETLLRKRLFNPLGMHDSAITLTPKQSSRRAVPHTASLVRATEWSKPWSTGMVHSTANDLMTFLAAAMNVKKTKFAPAFATMLTERRPAPEFRADQAIGWIISPFNGKPLIGHSGAGGGFVASILFDPATQIGVAVLSNTETIQDDLARHIVRPSLPLNVIATSVALPAALLDLYVGDYVDDAGVKVSILRTSEGISLRVPAGQRAPLSAKSETSFFVVGFAGLTVEFERDSAGKPIGMIWTLAGKTSRTRRL